MLGFSLTKVLFTFAAILLAWFAFKYVGRMAERKADGDAKRAAQRTAKEMTPCPQCGSFLDAQSARACGRDKCPYPG